MPRGVLRNFTKKSDAGLMPETLFKKGLWHRCFPVSSVKFLRTPLVAVSDVSDQYQSYFIRRTKFTPHFKSTDQRVVQCNVPVVKINFADDFK